MISGSKINGLFYYFDGKPRIERNSALAKGP